jgi:hypothetical protein
MMPKRVYFTTWQGCVKVLKNLTHPWKSEIVKHEARNSKQIQNRGRCV